MNVQIESYEDLGRYLSDVRGSMRVALKDAAQQLNIRAKYLQALEEGDLSTLPGMIYARGYIAHYAEYLGLDKEEVLETFDRIGAPNRKVKYYVPEPTSRHFQPGFVAILASVFVLALIYGYWHISQEVVPAQDVMAVPPVPQHLLATPGSVDTSAPPTTDLESQTAATPIRDAGSDIVDGGGASSSPVPADADAQKTRDAQTPSVAEDLPWLRQGNQ